jgi:hypothetical protein
LVGTCVRVCVCVCVCVYDSRQQIEGRMYGSQRMPVWSWLHKPLAAITVTESLV